MKHFVGRKLVVCRPQLFYCYVELLPAINSRATRKKMLSCVFNGRQINLYPRQLFGLDMFDIFSRLLGRIEGDRGWQGYNDHLFKAFFIAHHQYRAMNVLKSLTNI